MINILEPDDVVFAGVAAHLNLDDLERDLAGIAMSPELLEFGKLQERLFTALSVGAGSLG